MAQVLLSNNEGIVGVAVVTLPISDKEYSKVLNGVLKNLRRLLQKQAVCCVLTAEERRKIINVH